MRSSGLWVRRFSSTAQERAFLRDYARRFSGQRRLAIAIFTALWIVFSIHDFGRLEQIDPTQLHHHEVIFLRTAASVGMAIAVLFWTPRALDERWAIALLSLWTLSCWFAALRLLQFYPGDLGWREIYPVLMFCFFVVFMAFRLRVKTAAWLIGICIVSYLVMLYFKPVGGSVALRVESVTAHATALPLMSVVGVLLSIPLERSARREFIYRRTLSAAKARVEAASRAVSEQNSRMQELVKEKERFFSSAYHDIQQPLAAINLFIRSARTRLGTGHAIDHELDVIEETACDLLDMFKDIQDYSELGSYVPRVAPVNPRDVLTEVFEQYREAARLQGIAFRVTGRPQPVLIETDRSLFKRAVANLVSNAIKNTSSGGVVLGSVQLGERLRVDVWDTGIGIAAAHREAIFSEYYQVDNPGRDRSKGLGLGLSIVNRVMRILPGHAVRFASVEGRGSRFSVYAPVSALASAVRAIDRDRDVDAPDLDGAFLLVCDDDPVVLEGLRRLFSSAGALVHAAESMDGFEAILADDSRIPDLIVTDIRLRDGVTGRQVAERIRRHFGWAGVIPVAFVTGELLSDRVLREFPEPFILLRKSSTPADLLTDISRCVAANRHMNSGLAKHQ